MIEKTNFAFYVINYIVVILEYLMRRHEQYAYEPQNMVRTFQEAHSAAANAPLSVLQEPKIQYKEKIHFLAIDSGDRDRSKYPSPSSYTVHLEASSNQTGAVGLGGYRNVKCIELVDAVIPDKAATGSIFDEPYLFLNIGGVDGLDRVYNGTNRYITNSFAIMNLDSAVSSGKFININLDIVSKTPRIFGGRLGKIDKMTIEITDKDGDAFDFGTDASPPTAPTKGLQNTFVFKITTLEKSIDELNARGVY